MIQARQAKYLSPAQANRIRGTAKAQSQIARIAGVSRGQLWKVVNLHRRASPAVRAAIRSFFRNLRNGGRPSP